MAKFAREIMNNELFSLRPTDNVEQALGYILALGITGAPVLGEDHRPLGLASFRDLLSSRKPTTVRECMTAPAVTVGEAATIDQAAQILAEHDVHRAVVTDADGRATGMVSSLDVIRGLLGIPARHPASFPHFDKAFGITWSDDTMLELERFDVAPDGPGILVLISGGKGQPERIVWTEAPHNVRTRLHELVSVPQDNPLISRLLDHRSNLRFRAASVPADAARQTLARLLERLQTSFGLPPPKG